ncbi:hypothetical protein GGF37_004274, partial [Kickxella alabastrina]
MHVVHGHEAVTPNVLLNPQTNLALSDFMNRHQQVICQAHDTLAATQDAMTTQVNCNCCDILFKAGELVMISTSMINSDYECNHPSA